MEIIAKQKYIITSPKKLREVTQMIKKLTPSKAIEVLPFVGKRASMPLIKVIETAIANAKVKGINEPDLVFKEIQIGEGPRLKRFHAGAHGRVKPYKKRMSHIRLVLTTLEKPKVSQKIQSSKPIKNEKNDKKGEKNVTKD